jgi:hypothetical protein
LPPSDFFERGFARGAAPRKKKERAPPLGAVAQWGCDARACHRVRERVRFARLWTDRARNEPVRH